MVVCRSLGILILAAVFAASPPAWAQITTGTVTATVSDAQGGVLPGATVVLISETRGTRMVPAITNAQGTFVSPNITPDTYSVEVSMSGFKTLTRRNVPVSGGDRVTLPNILMEIGGQAETILVTAEAPMIQAESGERSFTASTEQVQNLPLGNRSFSSLTAFAPGVSGTARLGGGGSNNIMMDGVSVVDTGNNAQLLQMNVEAIGEVRVLTSTYQAEYGRSSGLQVAAVTKSGTNQFHGSVYGVMRDSDWNSTSWADLKNGNPKPVSEQTDWGYSLGGPIGKPGGNNKLFFFFSQEWRPRTTGGATRQFRLPTAAERTGDFSQTRNQNGAIYNLIRDASTGLPCTAADTRGCFQADGVVGKIPQDRLYQPGLNILKMYPLPNVDRAGVGYNYELVDPTERYLNNQPALRVDYQPVSSTRLTFKYAGEQQRQQIFLGTLPGFNDTQMHDPVVRTFSGTVNYSLTPTTFLEATYGFSRNAVAGCGNIFSNCRTSIPMSPSSNKLNVGLADLPVLFPEGLVMDPRYYQYGELQKIGAPWFVDGTILLPPNFSWGGRITTPPPNNVYPNFINFNLTQDFSVSITKVMGRHTLKAGYYNGHSHKAENRGITPQLAGGPGQMNFGENTSNPLDSTFGFANAALGVFNQYAQLSNFMEGRFVYDNREFFVQDNWKITPRLTLDYGVRFVHQGPQYDSLGQSSNFLWDRWQLEEAPVLYTAGCPNNVVPCANNARQAKNPITGELLGPNSALAIGGVVPNSGNQSQGVFLAGEGISKGAYEWPALAPAPRVGAAYDVSGSQSIVVRGGAGLFFDRPQGFPNFDLITNPPNAKNSTVSFGRLQTLGAEGLQVDTPATLRAFQYESNLPSSTQWNAGIQMALPWASALDVTYVGQHSFNVLPGGTPVNINAVDFGAAFLPGNQDPTRASSPVLGATAVTADLMRSYRGYSAINVQLPRGWNQYHSIQSSFRRRMMAGLSFGVNHTLGLSNRGSTPARLEHDADGQWRYMADQAAADELLGDQGLNRHTIKGYFVWELPVMQTDGGVFMRAVAAVVNDWQLSGVYSGQSGSQYSVAYQYDSNGEATLITGSPDYTGRVVINGDHGSGCSGDQFRQFNTEAFSGPLPGSLGLESGQNYLSGCFSSIWDFSLARNIRLGSGKHIQVRLDAFNAFNTVVFTGRQTTVRLASPTDQRVTNSQFDENGQVVESRIAPNNAGFGAATAAAPPRSVQVQLRFGF